jgi:hypothetical protein
MLLLRLAAIAASIASHSNFAGSLSCLCSAAQLITLDMKRLLSWADANC